MRERGGGGGKQECGLFRCFNRFDFHISCTDRMIYVVRFEFSRLGLVIRNFIAVKSY